MRLILFFLTFALLAGVGAHLTVDCQGVHIVSRSFEHEAAAVILGLAAAAMTCSIWAVVQIVSQRLVKE